MRLTNSQYDRIKWIALVVIPATNVLILTIGKIWGLPYYTEIAATVAAIGVFLAAIIHESSQVYYADQGEIEDENDVEYINEYDEEDGDEENSEANS